MEQIDAIIRILDVQRRRYIDQTADGNIISFSKTCFKFFGCLF